MEANRRNRARRHVRVGLRLGRARAFLEADVVNDGDMRMIERRRRPRLLLEARQPLGIRSELGRQHLDRHLAAQTRVLTEVDLAHAASA